MMRTILACALALMTSACAVVGSETPLFSVADARGHPVLKPGLWVMPDEDCTFDPSAAPDTWDDCANATWVSATAFTEAQDAQGGPADTMDYVLAGGDPRIVQVKAPEAKEDPDYAYAGLRPIRADEAGRIVEARVWLAICEPPPKTSELLAEGAKDDASLPAGLSRKPGVSHCLARNAKAVRDAVGRSEAWSADGKFSFVARWLRDAP